jgi:hypothetical protein
MWVLGLALLELALEREVAERPVPVRRWWEGRGLLLDSSSDGTDEEDSEVGGEALLSRPGVKTRAHGARVLRVGPRSGRDPAPASRLLSWRFGRVSAQLSHGPARRVTYSS